MTKAGVTGGFLTRSLLVAAVSLAWVGQLRAQQGQQIPAPTRVTAQIMEVKPIMQKTPEFQAVTSESKKDPKRREWLELEMEFKTESDSRVGILPELTISYYLAVKGSTPQVLTGTFTYANVVDKEPNFAVVYVSPNGLTRIAGEPNKFRVGDVVKVGVEILYQGRVVAESDKSKWWTTVNAPKTDGLLLPKEKTPFGMLWLDRHVELREGS